MCKNKGILVISNNITTSYVLQGYLNEYSVVGMPLSRAEKLTFYRNFCVFLEYDNKDNFKSIRLHLKHLNLWEKTIVIAEKDYIQDLRDSGVSKVIESIARDKTEVINELESYFSCLGEESE